jgi:Sec-independent protein translocase protein TatA
MVVSMLDEQKKHAEVAKTNGAAIQEIRAAVAALTTRLEGHMEDEEGKIESNAEALRALAGSVVELTEQLGPQHKLHHDWIAHQITLQEERTETWKKIRMNVATWGIIAIVGLLVSWLFDGFVDWMAQHVRPK